MHPLWFTTGMLFFLFIPNVWILGIRSKRTTNEMLVWDDWAEPLRSFFFSSATLLP